MQRSAAIASALSTISRAPSSVFCSSASAALCAKGPPEPMATMPCSGSSTSPAPVMMSECSRSATASIASSRRRMRSVRQSLASSTAERIRLPWCLSSFASKRSNKVKASAVPPAKPARIWSLCRRRTFFAPPLTTTLPSVTCPSPPSATWPSRRTERMVVPWNSCMGSEPDLWTRYLEPVSKISSLHPFPPMNRRARGSGEEAHAEERHDANDQRPRGQIGDGGSEKPGRVSRRPDAIACGEASARKPARSERGNNQRGEHKVQADELHRKRHRASEHEVEAAAPHPAAQAQPHREDRRREEADDREPRRRDPQDLPDEK